MYRAYRNRLLHLSSCLQERYGVSSFHWRAITFVFERFNLPFRQAGDRSLLLEAQRCCALLSLLKEHKDKFKILHQGRKRSARAASEASRWQYLLINGDSRCEWWWQHLLIWGDWIQGIEGWQYLWISPRTDLWWQYLLTQEMAVTGIYCDSFC